MRPHASLHLERADEFAITPVPVLPVPVLQSECASIMAIMGDTGTGTEVPIA